MSSSTNLETLHLLQRDNETKVFEKFGMKFALNICTETRDEWAMGAFDGDGILLDVKDEEVQKRIEAGDIKPVLNWYPTGETITSKYVKTVNFQDKEDCKRVRPIEVLSTADGPIMGIVFGSDSKAVTLMDPCLVQFDGTRITLSPIFNVARTLRLNRSAIRTTQAPAEMLTAVYPGFIIQNRMFKYQLKPVLPFATTPDLETSADVEIATEVP